MFKITDKSITFQLNFGEDGEKNASVTIFDNNFTVETRDIDQPDRTRLSQFVNDLDQFIREHPLFRVPSETRQSIDFSKTRPVKITDLEDD